ncbi:MAG TPA: CoA pyrophosphatase, partial [Thauera aminoaromatica]|nr:CoA pyrophosphatase [Thauera aminoaromatica]
MNPASGPHGLPPLEQIRRRLAEPRREGCFNGDGRDLARSRPPKPAAVLVPLVVRGEAPSVLLTRRTDHLHHHPGEISFPGGRLEDDDPSPVHAALRETEGEIGLARRHVELIGALPDYFTGTGFRVTPVVGLVH